MDMNRDTRSAKRGWKILGILILAGVLCYTSLIAYVAIREKQLNTSLTELKKDYDAIIVLGAQVLPSGEPNTQLAWRLDAALEAWEEKWSPIIVCGAQGADEPLPEAEAMRNYLAARGIPKEMILMDPDSFNTHQNLKNAVKLLEEWGGVRKVLIVTSDYHLPRALAIAGDLGYDAVGLGSPCKQEYWLKNHAREALAWLKYRIQKLTGQN